MNPRRTLLVALAALALATSAAALSTPSQAQGDDPGTTNDTSGQDAGNETDGSGGNETDGSNGSASEDEEPPSQQDESPRNGSDGTRDADDRRRDRPPERTGPERRDVRVDVEDDRATFRSEARDGDARSDLRLELRGDDATLRLDFENRSRDARVEIGMETRHTVLREFHDADGDGVLDPDEPVVQQVDLRDRVPTVTLDETPVGPRVTSAYDLPDGGTFAVEVLLPSGPARVGAQDLTPDEAKIEYRIDGFPFQENGTRLALQVQVETETETRGAADPSGVTLEGEGAAGYYRWVPNATVDGAVQDVATRVDALQATADDGEAETEHVIHLAYARGETIVHDPTFGVESLEGAAQAVRETLGHLPAYVVAAGATALLAGGIAYARTRRSPR